MATDLCPVCGELIYVGGPARYVSGYDMRVHTICWLLNRDGWALGEERILKHLLDKGIRVPPRNSKGFLPRDYPLE